MITPRFRVTQSESTITINIRAPYSNLRDLEVTVDENVFIYLNSPYYLRLHLPGRIVEDDFTKSSFDADSGEFTFTFNKANDGEYFPNLDLITTLLPPRIQTGHVQDKGGKLIIPIEQGQQKSHDELEEEFGFALSGKNNFFHVSAEFKDIFEVDPREIKLCERHKMRLQYEQGKFNLDHYLSDYIENEEILEIMALKSPWSCLDAEQIEFTERELDFLKDLPHTQYCLNNIQISYCHYSLIDILFGYCYDRRTTYFDGSSESGWTIVKLAASLCWLDVFQSPQEALISAFRRSLIYTLYRNFDLSQTVFKDLRQILNLGEKYIIKCLIEMHDIFLKGDYCHYILNTLFIKDYIVYIMKWDKEKWREVVSQVQNKDVTKAALGLNLKEIEDDVCTKLSKLTQLNITSDDSDDTDDSSTDDSEDTSNESNSGNSTTE